MNFSVTVNFGQIVDAINGKKGCPVNWSCDGLILMIVACFDQLEEDFLCKLTFEQWLDIFIIAKHKNELAIANRAFQKLEELSNSFSDWLMICQKCNGSHLDKSMAERAMVEISMRAETLEEYIKAFFAISFREQDILCLDRSSLCADISAKIQILIANASLEELFKCSLLFGTGNKECSEIANLVYMRLKTAESTYDEWWNITKRVYLDFQGYKSKRFDELINRRLKELFSLENPDFMK
ncbi:MAG: hypothetical protein ACD_9C00099G0003 [uncultured bacterium]|nr:MAG: hypothetical protein ACD_9C00099G0003 [uncultured bacterium]